MAVVVEDALETERGLEKAVSLEDIRRLWTSEAHLPTAAEAALLDIKENDAALAEFERYQTAETSERTLETLTRSYVTSTIAIYFYDAAIGKYRVGFHDVTDPAEHPFVNHDLGAKLGTIFPNVVDKNHPLVQKWLSPDSREGTLRMLDLPLHGYPMFSYTVDPRTEQDEIVETSNLGNPSFVELGYLGTNSRNSLVFANHPLTMAVLGDVSSEYDQYLFRIAEVMNRRLSHDRKHAYRRVLYPSGVSFGISGEAVMLGNGVENELWHQKAGKVIIQPVVLAKTWSDDSCYCIDASPGALRKEMYARFIDGSKSADK